MKVVIYNDTRERSRIHFGCQLVMESFLYQLNRVGIEVIGTLNIEDVRKGNISYRLLDRADLVIVNGEGSLHHDRRNDLVSIADKYPSVLVNSLFQENKKIDAEALSKFKDIRVRESFSLAEVNRLGVANAKVMPDVIFTAPLLKESRRYKPINSIVVDHYKGVKTLQPAESFLPALLDAARVHTISHHAACLCLYYKIPLNTKDLNTFKVQALMNDAGMSAYHNTDIYGVCDTEYVQNGIDSINKYFEGLWHIK